MSDFHVVVVEIGETAKHPQADKLGITHVNGNYQVIFGLDDFKKGDKAIYITPDALVPVADPRFAFLEKDAKNGYARIKAKKLRGIFSHGLLVKCDEDFKIGQDVRVELGVNKWEPQDNAITHGRNAKAPPINWPTYDLESLRKYPNVLKEGEQVILTEKIHGANARFSWQNGQLHIGSHRTWKAHDTLNVWVRAAQKYDLADKLPKYENFTFYGEVFGWVQDLKYGATKDQIFFQVFDIRNQHGYWLPWDEVFDICNALAIPTVPVLYSGPWKPELVALADGQATDPMDHSSLIDQIREGIVIKTNPERFCEVGRTAFKYVSEAYLTRKGQDAENCPIMVEEVKTIDQGAILDEVLALLQEFPKLAMLPTYARIGVDRALEKFAREIVNSVQELVTRRRNGE